MSSLEHRLGKLEEASPPDWRPQGGVTTTELCNYMAALAPRDMAARVQDLTEEELSSCIDEVRRVVVTVQTPGEKACDQLPTA